MAPEILLNQPYDYKVDIFSLGITAYCMHFGKFPFNEADVGNKLNKIKDFGNTIKQLQASATEVDERVS